MDDQTIAALEREAASVARRTDDVGRRRAAEVAAELRAARGASAAPEAPALPRRERRA